MHQRDFIRLMQRLYPSVTQEDGDQIFAMVVTTLREALVRGESILLPKLGRFFPIFIERERQWKNPATGEISTLGNKVRLRFRITRDFEQAMNERLLNAESIDTL